MTQAQVAGIGRRVAEYRKRNGWSAQRLADNTDGAVSRSTIANLENGRRDDLGLHQFLAICLALRVPSTALLIDLHDPFAPAPLRFPGPAPAPLEPAAPQIAFARWLTGKLPDSSTPAARHAHLIAELLRDYLATTDDLQVAAVRDRLTHPDGPPAPTSALHARRDELEAALRAAGVHLCNAPGSDNSNNGRSGPA